MLYACVKCQECPLIYCNYITVVAVLWCLRFPVDRVWLLAKHQRSMEEIRTLRNTTPHSTSENLESMERINVRSLTLVILSCEWMVELGSGERYAKKILYSCSNGSSAT